MVISVGCINLEKSDRFFWIYGEDQKVVDICSSYNGYYYYDCEKYDRIHKEGQLISISETVYRNVDGELREVD